RTWSGSLDGATTRRKTACDGGVPPASSRMIVLLRGTRGWRERARPRGRATGPEAFVPGIAPGLSGFPSETPVGSREPSAESFDELPPRHPSRAHECDRDGPGAWFRAVRSQVQRRPSIPRKARVSNPRIASTGSLAENSPALRRARLRAG